MKISRKGLIEAGSSPEAGQGRSRLWYGARTLRPTSFVLLGVTILGTAGCMYPPKSFENPQLREQYEKEFANRELDPIEGFWRSANEYGEGIGVIYRVDPAENAGFPFAHRAISGHQKVALPHRITDEDFYRVMARVKPTAESGVYRGEGLMVRGRQKFWEDITIRLIDPTTLEMTYHSSGPVLGGRTQRAYLLGPKPVLEKRLEAIAKLEKEKRPVPGERPSEDKKGPATLSSGSGFLVADGLIITNQHVVEDAHELSCTVGGKSVALSIVAQDLSNDLVLLKCEEPLQTAARLFRVGDAGSVRQGMKVYALGYPLPDVLGKDLHVHEGIVSSLTGFQGSSAEYQIEMAINPGNSGGPLVDQHGIVIGVVSAKLGLRYPMRTGTIPEGVTFAVKCDFIRTLAHSAGLSLSPPTQLDEQAEVSLEELVAEYGASVVRIEAK